MQDIVSVVLFPIQCLGLLAGAWGHHEENCFVTGPLLGSLWTHRLYSISREVGTPGGGTETLEF